MSMQITNASTPGNGVTVNLSPNVSWVYPFPPGEPPNVLLYNTSLCIASDILLSQTCCSAVNGTFVTNELSNRATVSQSDLLEILNAKYPNRNNTYDASSNTITGDLTPASSANSTSDVQVINWCSMQYNPLSNNPIQKGGYVSGGELYGNVPQSIEDWISCFNANTPANATGKLEAVYICRAKDVLTGGAVEGSTQVFDTTTSGAERTTGLGRMVMGLAFLGLLGLGAL
jgi:hypothetical protein